MLPFVRKHAPILLADLRREYGIDLLDLWRGRLSFYELCAYLTGLSVETRSGRLMREMPEETEGWGIVPTLLGVLVDSVRQQWNDKPVESIVPRALTDMRGQPRRREKLEMQPDSAAMALLGSPSDFIKRHAGR